LLVQQSYETRRRAMYLLDKAKKDVEEAIEKTQNEMF
jgi:hypothetical protein